jgi:hypothetical protein
LICDQGCLAAADLLVDQQLARREHHLHLAAS